MLFEKYCKIDPKDLSANPETIMPFPGIEDRSTWESILPESREYWLALAEKYIEYDWPALKMDRYIDFRRTGNTMNYVNLHFERRSVLGTFVVAECIEGKGRFLDQIINGIFSICEETTWVPPLANRYLQKTNTKECLPDRQDHIVDLNSSETAALLAVTYYLLKVRLDSISLRIGSRIEQEVRERVLEPYIAIDDYWWMGFLPGVRVNNWNPWCNSNVLTCFLLMEKDLDVRDRGIRKILKSLDIFLETHSPDGCCDEGPMYWSRSGGSLYDCLEFLYRATGSKINGFTEPLVQEIGRYLYKVHICGDYYANFADGDAKAGTFGDVAFSCGKAIKDVHLLQLGASIPNQTVEIINWFPLYRYVRGLLNEKERRAYGQKAPFILYSWMMNTQVMTAREVEGSEKGLYIAAKGGHNKESHNHNDVGSFIVYCDGLPVFIDLGTEEYSAKTFGPNRFDLWYLQSAYHNTPTIHGAMQNEGGDFKAKAVSCSHENGISELVLEIEEAYPKEAGVESWLRTFRMIRGIDAVVEIEDSFILSDCTEELYFSLMTVCEPKLAEEGAFTLEYAEGKYIDCTFNTELLSMKSERIDLTDKRLKSNWGDTVYRVVLKVKVPVRDGKLKLVVAKRN